MSAYSTMTKRWKGKKRHSAKTDTTCFFLSQITTKVHFSMLIRARDRFIQSNLDFFEPPGAAEAIKNSRCVIYTHSFPGGLQPWSRLTVTLVVCRSTSKKNSTADKKTKKNLNRLQVNNLCCCNVAEEVHKYWI